MLVKDLQVDLLAVEFGRDLTEMQRRAGEPVQAGHDERVAFPHIFQACLSSRPFAPGTAGFLLKDFVAVV